MMLLSRSLLSLALLLVILTPAHAQDCSFSTDGDWSAGCGNGDPLATENITVNADIEVRIDDGTAVCRTLTINGTVWLDADQSANLVATPTSSLTGITIASGGTLIVNGGTTVEFDNVDGTPILARLTVASGGKLFVHGDHITGTTTLDVTEDDGVPAFDNSALQVEIRDDRQTWDADQFNTGHVLVWTSGSRRNWWYDITATTPSTLDMDYTSLGNTDVRPWATAYERQDLTVTTGSGVGAPGNVTITLDGDDQIVALSDNSDAAIATATEIVAGGTGSIVWADLGDGWQASNIEGGVSASAVIIFRSLVKGNKAGSFTFADTDVTGAAASFAESHAGYDSPDLRFDITKGDSFRVINQAVIQTIAADQAVGDRNWFLRCEDGAICDFIDAKILGAGIKGEAQGIDCNAIDNSNTAENFAMSYTEVTECASARCITLDQCANVVLDHVYLHDSHADIGLVGNTGHGFEMLGASNVTLSNIHCARMNDDCILVNSSGATDTSGLTISRPILHDIPDLPSGNSAQAIDTTGCFAGCVYEDGIIFHIRDPVLDFVETNNTEYDVLIVDMIAFDLLDDLTDGRVYTDCTDKSCITFTNNFFADIGLEGIQVMGSSYFNTLVNFNRLNSSAGAIGIQDGFDIIGNLLWIDHSDNLSSLEMIQWATTSYDTDLAAPIVRDNLLYGAADHNLFITDQAAALTWTIDNNTIIGRKSVAGGDATGRLMRIVGANNTVTLTDNLFAHAKAEAIRLSSGTLNNTFNFYFDPTSIGVTVGTGGIQNGGPSFGGTTGTFFDFTPPTASPNYNVGSAPGTAENHMGARCYGAAMHRIYYADVGPVESWDRVCMSGLIRDSDGDGVPDYVDSSDFDSTVRP